MNIEEGLEGKVELNLNIKGTTYADIVDELVDFAIRLRDEYSQGKEILTGVSAGATHTRTHKISHLKK